MRFSEFTYEKANGSISKRSVILLNSENKNEFGIDVSELDNDEYAEFILELIELRKKQDEELAALMAKHDLKYRFRQFKPEMMTNITTTTL